MVKIILGIKFLFVDRFSNFFVEFVTTLQCKLMILQITFNRGVSEQVVMQKALIFVFTDIQCRRCLNKTFSITITVKTRYGHNFTEMLMEKN